MWVVRVVRWGEVGGFFREIFTKSHRLILTRCRLQWL